MEKKSAEISKTEWFKTKVRHGLLLQGIRNRLVYVGIDIKPYYWVQERVREFKIPEIKGNKADYLFLQLGQEEIKSIASYGLESYKRVMLEGLKKGHICIGLKCNKEIVAFMTIEFNNFTYRNKDFTLKENEVYLFNMYTLESYRGKNLGPYLRYCSYELLNGMGTENIFSISDYFNKPTHKFKKKLNSKHLKLYIFIELFKKWQWNFLLREYN